MLPQIITDNSITFFARGQPWVLASDHANFATIRELLVSGSDDEDRLINLTDVRSAVSDATLGRAVLTEDGLFLNGEKLSHDWEAKAAAEPEAMRVLIVKQGDRVRVEGDDDAPDGIYTVGDVDPDDTEKRVYLESDEDFFGFVSNKSIKEILP